MDSIHYLSGTIELNTMEYTPNTSLNGLEISAAELERALPSELTLPRSPNRSRAGSLHSSMEGAVNHTGASIATPAPAPVTSSATARAIDGGAAVTAKESASGPIGGSGNSTCTTNTCTTTAAPAPPTATPIRIGAQHFELQKLIGAGAFGKVILARNMINNGAS